MSFCNRCGQPLKAPGGPTPVAPAPLRPERYEGARKDEAGFHPWFHYAMGPLIGGSVLIALGLLFYLITTGMLSGVLFLPVFLALIGLLVIVLGVYAAATARRTRRP